MESTIQHHQQRLDRAEHNLATYADQHVDITTRMSQAGVDRGADRWQLAGIQFSPMSSG